MGIRAKHRARQQHAGRSVLALVTSLLLVLSSALAVAASASSPNASAATSGVGATVGVTKTIVGGGTTFAPGVPFTYDIKYTCSSQTDPGCYDAVVTDVLPAGVVFDSPVTLGTDPASWSQSTVTDGGQQRTKITVAFNADLGGGKTGLAVGRTGHIYVTVHFPDGTPDGTLAHNCADISASNAAEAPESCADATSKTVPSYQVNLTKRYTSPYTGDSAISGVQGTGPTSTLDLSAKVGGNQPATSVTVVDPDPNQTSNNKPFDSFNLTDFKPFGLASGVQAEVSVRIGGNWVVLGTYTGTDTAKLGSNDPAAVTGIKVVYTRTDGKPIAVGTTLDLKAGVQLRNTLRSDSGTAVSVGTVHNQAAVAASYADHADETDTATADYTVVAPSTKVDAGKKISPSQAQQGSKGDITMTVSGTNTGNVDATQMTVTDPDPTTGAKPFDIFTFKNFTRLAVPNGVTVAVMVYDSSTSQWVTLGSAYSNGQTPQLTDNNSTVATANVAGVQYVYSGPIPQGTTVSNSFVTTLKDSAKADTYKDVNCASASITTGVGTGASQSRACVNFTVTAVTTSISAGKSFSPTNGTAGTGASTTVTLTGKNTSNVPISTFVLEDPGTGTGGGTNLATFDAFTVTGFGEITVPSGTKWAVEVTTNGTTWQSAGTGLESGATPTLPGGVSADQVVGVRYTLTDGSIPANTQAISTTLGLSLRTTNRTTDATITSGTVHNCVTASSTGIPDASSCADYEVQQFDAGTGVGVGKNIAKGSVVQNTGEATDVTLTGKNGANAPVSSIVLEDRNDINVPSNGVNTFWNSFSFNGFGTTAWPSGATGLKVEYYDGNGWNTVGTYTDSNQLPPSLSSSDYATVQGLRYTWTGQFAAGATVSATFSAKVKDGAATGSVQDCVQQTYSGGQVVTPVVTSACDSITIKPQTHTVSPSKSFDPPTGTLGLSPRAATTATLSVTNTSNVGIDSIVVTEPSATDNDNNALANPFTAFALTGFGQAHMPANVQLSVEVSTDGGSNWTTVATGVTNGQTPAAPTDPAGVNAVRLTYTATSGQIPANSSAMSLGLKLSLRDTVTAAGPIENCFAATGSVTGSTVDGGIACATYTVQANNPGVSASKTWIPGSGVRDLLPSSTITMKGSNFSGNVPLDALVLQDPAAVDGSQPAVKDTAFDYVTVTGLSGLVFPQDANRVKIDVLTADGAWHPGAAQPGLPTGAEINGVALADIVGVRATFSNADGGKLPVVTDAGATGNVGIDVTLRSTLRMSGGAIDVPPGKTVTVDNTSSAIGYVGNTPTSPATATARYTITSGAVKVAPDKTLYPAGSTANAGPDSPVTYRLQIKNTGDRNLVAPVVLDSFDPTLLRYDPTQDYPRGKYEFDGNQSSLTGTDLKVTYDAAKGAVTFQFDGGDYLAPGETAYIKIVLYTQPGLAAGTDIVNTYGVTWNVQTNGPIACTSGLQEIDGTTYCTDTQAVKVSKAQAMGSVKWIKGDDVPPTNVVTAGNPCPAPGDDLAGYTKYPCIAHTHTGGIFDYTLQVTVTGNVSIGTARVVDVLPHVGDTGLIDTRARNTEWTPTLQSEVGVTGLPEGAHATVYYATTDNPCGAPTDSLDNPTQQWCSDWKATAPTDLSTVKAIGVEVTTADGQPLQPAQAFNLHWKMKAPDTAPGGNSQYYPDAEAGPIAWNSFAFTGLPTDNSGWLLPAEPNKVGIDLTNPTVKVSKTTTGGDGTFEFTLTPVDPVTHKPTGDPLTGDVTTTDGSGSYTWGSPHYALTPGGTYTLAETGQDAWSAQFGSCTNRGGALTPVGSGAGYVTFVAPPNGQVTCSFDNTKRPSVVVEKTATGDGGTFGFTLQPTNPAGDRIAKDITVGKNQTGSLQFGPAGLLPGDYTLTETVQGEWVSDFVQCTAGGKPIGATLTDGRTGVAFTAAAGDQISCAFTNTKRPGITVVKTATGGAGTFGFTLTPEGDATGGGAVDLDVSDGGTATHTWGPDGLTPGGTYTLAETVDDGWISTFQQCTGVEPTSHTDTSVTFVAQAGAEISCAFSNTKRPQITVLKSTVGASTGSFPFVLQGPGGSTQTVSVTDGAGSASWGPQGLEPGEYTLYEDTTDSAGQWESTFAQCLDGGSNIGTPLTDGRVGVTFTAQPGSEVHCSFSNAKRPTITVAKAADGGDGTFGFALTPVDPTTGDPAGAAMTQDVTTTGGAGSATWGPAGLTPGGTYTLTETGDVDWISTFVRCIDLSDTSAGDLSFTALANSQVGAQFTAEPGAQIVCSFSNTKRPVLVVHKTTVGAADGEFPFVLDGVGGSTQQVTVADGTGTATWGPTGLEPGDYTLSEDTSGLSGEWVSKFEQCTALGSDGPVGTPSADGTGVALTLAAGSTVVCSFTNTQRPTITVHKSAAGGDGTFTFSLTPKGDAVGGGSVDLDVADGGSADHTWNGLTPGGTYTLTETEQVGWTGEFTDCTVGGRKVDVSADGLSVTLTAEAGANITCSFVNTKIQVLPTSSTLLPPTSAPTTGPTGTPPTVAPTSSTIAYTGVNTLGMGWVALLLLAGGGLLLLVGTVWRRRPGRH